MWLAPVEQNHQVISVKTFWLRALLIDFVRVGMLLWNTETDERCIVELYQFLRIYYWLVRIFNSSGDALLVRVKRENFKKNMDYSTGFVFNHFWLKWLRLSRCMMEIFKAKDISMSLWLISTRARPANCIYLKKCKASDFRLYKYRSGKQLS